MTYDDQLARVLPEKGASCQWNRERLGSEAVGKRELFFFGNGMQQAAGTLVQEFAAVLLQADNK